MTKDAFSGLFISGTDTGVGKTMVTAGIAAALRQDGEDIGVWKPVQSGALANDPDSDACRLKQWSGVADSCTEIAPLVFPAPLTPLLAAEAIGKSLTMDEVVAGGRLLQQRHTALLVEGAGGLAVPLTRADMMAQLAAHLKLPLLLVARAGLGTINHTLLSVWYARELGIEVAGVILNETRPEETTDESVKTNAKMIEYYGQVPVWGTFPWIDETLQQQKLVSIVREQINLEKIRTCITSQVKKGEMRR
ncbi:dethiobiotin synthase [Brevibacillus reuszeri]|uniref:dethiobiotin synthase n=1 Tax=Brevibacillus reuszeri TaxID=54915 RepID=UPI002896EE52|nr:dethiobiotin synthase [Brevibacillus reuszeri]